METNKCRECGVLFTLTIEDMNLLSAVGINNSLECTECIWKKILSLFVFGRFRKTKSALSGKSIITNFPESTQFPLYEKSEWNSDAWDPMKYGKDYDTKKGFFEQLEALEKSVPHPHQSGTKNTDCDWCDDVWNCKNCYLCRSLLDCENVSYGYRTFACKDSIDLAFCFKMDSSYDSVYCFNSYRVHYSFNVHDSMDSLFLYDCRNVKDCFMCWNLRNKQYYILNEQYTKEEYFQKIKSLNTKSFSGIQDLKKEFWKIVAKNAVHRENYNTKTIDSVGNFLSEDKNCQNCFFLDRSENCRHVFRGFETKDGIYTVASIGEKCAFSAIDGYIYETTFTSHCTSCRYSAFLDYCEECEYCFGCVGLRKKKYCILNKQYTKEEYEELKEKIVKNMKEGGEWGRFFPYSMGYCGYNFTLAEWYFPETKENILSKGGIWEETKESDAEGISGNDVPDIIDEVPDDFFKNPIICPKSGWKFNVAPHELEFYRRQGIPLPHHHFDVRTMDRFRPLTSFRSYDGTCFFCKKAISHFYPKTWGYEKIACVECYQKEVA